MRAAIYARYSSDLQHRGVEGRVRQGRSGGGLCYGYEVVREVDARGEPVRGGRRINEDEANIVRRIFREFCCGPLAPRAMQLKAEGIRGPNGASWGPSTIYGNWRPAPGSSTTNSTSASSSGTGSTS